MADDEKRSNAAAIGSASPLGQLAKTTTNENDLYGMQELGRTTSAGVAAAGEYGVVITPELATGVGEAAGVPQPEHPPLSMARTIGIALVTTMAMSLSGAGSMSLSIALPKIQQDLNMPESQLQWISSAFSLTNGCFLLLSGRVADVYGRKACFIAGVAWHALWCLIGGFMHSAPALVVTRAMAGIGSALSIPSAIGIIASSFSGRTRASAFACFSAGGPIGGGLGLIIGGLLVAYTDQSWRAALWTFAASASLVAAWGFLVVLPDRNLDPDRRIDWIGAGIITIGLVLLQFSVSYAQDAPNGWKTSYIIALLVISILMIASFFLWEHHVEKRTTRPPLMRLALWTRAKGKLAATYFIGGISWMGFSTMFYSATLFYQQVQMTGTIGAMLRFMPTTISGLLCNILVAKIVHIVPNQILICVGIAATGLSNIFFAIAPRDAYYWRLPFNAMWLTVLGADFLMAVGSIFVSTLALPEEQSVAGALFQTLVQLGGALGLAFVSVVQTSLQHKALANGADPVDALLKGLHGAFWFAAGASFTAFAIAAVVLRDMGKPGTPNRKAASTRTTDSEATAAETEKQVEAKV